MSSNLSIVEKPTKVNLTPTTVTLQPCPWCCQDAATGLSYTRIQQTHHGPCSHCGGVEEVLDGIRNAKKEGYPPEFWVFVQGVEFGTTEDDRIYSMAEAAEIYYEERIALAVELDRLGGIVRGQEKLKQWTREFNETPIFFN